MRTLNATADAARQLHSYGGVKVALKIEFPDHDRYFTDGWEPSDVSSSVLYTNVSAWGDLLTSLSDNGRFPQAIGNITMIDSDGELWSLWEQYALQRLPCTLYWTIWTPGEAVPSLAQSTSIIQGAIAPPTSWTEYDLSISFSITDYGIAQSRTIALRATKEDYPNIAIEDEGRVVPLVYGRVRGFRGISITGGPVARLSASIDDEELEFLVDDASQFPQSTPITVEIDNEQIEGSFNGNTFTVTGRAAVVYTGRTTLTPPANRAVAYDSALIGYHDNAFVGYMFRPGSPLTDALCNRVQTYAIIIGYQIPIQDVLDSKARQIRRFDGTIGLIEFASSFVIETQIGYTGGGIVTTTNIQANGTEVVIKKGMDFTIQTLRASHEVGASVRVVNEPAEYLVARGDQTVRQVYIHGKSRPPVNTYKYSAHGLFGSISELVSGMMNKQTRPEIETGWLPVPHELWDFRTVAHPTTGEILTVLRLLRPPHNLPDFDVDSDQVLVDMASPITNPAEVIEDICNSYGGMTVDYSTVALQLDGWHMDFCLDDETTLLELISDLAYQARCAFRWDETEPELIYLHANGGTADLAIGRGEIISSMEGNSTFMTTREEIDSAYSSVTVVWNEQGELIGDMKEQKHVESDATAAASIGDRNLTVNCWAYDSEVCPKIISKFLLERFKHNGRIIETEVSVYGMALEPGDIVATTHPILPLSPEIGQVVSTVHRPGRNPDTPDTVGLVLRQFNWPGCGATGCQGFCETSNCEVSCQTGWQPAACWTCQTDCQTRCEIIACVTAAQSICVDNSCQTSATSGCYSFCMPTTMDVGCGHCETVDCETVDCQTTGCQTTDCETLDCQTTDCQSTACQSTDCQSADCQTTGCQSTDCETLDCQTLNCQSLNCQTLNCQTLNCQTTACQSTAQ